MQTPTPSPTSTLRWLCAGLLLGAVAGPAEAGELRYRLSGVTGAIVDPDGLLGAPAAGTPFELDFIADFSVGWRSSGVGGFGSSNGLVGGSSYEAQPFYPTIQISPVSALLTVGGHTLSFSGEYAGQVEYTQNWFDEQFGGYAYSWATLLAQAGADDALQSRVGASLASPFSADVFGDIEALKTPLPVDGTTITGSASFSYRLGGGEVSGELAPATFAVNAVPEPASWLLLAAGGVALAGVARRRRASADGAG